MEQVTKRFFNWASILEGNTRAQVQMTSEMPFIFPHVALMPDAHDVAMQGCQRQGCGAVFGDGCAVVMVPSWVMA